MCGILGSVNAEIKEDDLDLLRHRGPDDSDLVQLKSGQDVFYLGHVRLSIQDLSQAGHQPMYSNCGKFVIVFNGEVYNHLELRKKLSGVEFKGHSDTETIVNYIACFGIQSVQHFNGIFGLAVVDIESRELYLVRDRYGVKPLYYFQHDKDFLFSSEIEPMKRLVNPTLSKDDLATLLTLRYNPSPGTLYKEIRKLRPGHILKYDLANYSVSISSFVKPVNINTRHKFDESLSLYGDLFEQAIKRQLLADVEVGVLLSGGIDSALVAYYAQKYSDKPVKTFTVGFEDAHHSDETKEARRTAEILGTDHYERLISAEEFENIFGKCIDIVEEPLGTTSIIPMYFLNELASQHVKVVLTGQGADEPLGGYNKYRGDRLHGKVPRFVWRALQPFSPLIKNESLYRAVNSLAETDAVSRYKKIYSLFSREEIKRLIGVDGDNSLAAINYFYKLLNGEQKDSTSAMMSNDIRMSLCDDLLLYTDKISMSFSVEARVPMLDNDLVDFIESLPISYKISGKHGKYIHKKFAESVLPREIIYREKKAFQSPTDQWFKGDKGKSFCSLLTQKGSVFAESFDLEEVARIFQIHNSGRRNMEKQLFTLISLYYFMESGRLDLQASV